MSTKVYVHLTGKVPSVFFSTLAKPVKLSNVLLGNILSFTDLSDLYDLTTRDTYNNIISNVEFKNFLKLDYIRAYDEYGIEIDNIEDKFLGDIPASESSVVTKEYYITGDNVQDVFTFTHNEDTPNYKGYLYESYEVFVDGIPKEHLRECEGYFRNDPDNPNNVVKLVVGMPLYATLFKVILQLFKGVL